MISVIMPVFNAERFVAEAVRSVLQQDHADLELLVVDNNCTDRTMEVVRSFTDPRLRILHQPEQGVSAARNMALEHMRGAFFCFLDPDDTMPQGSLSARLSVLKADERVFFADGTWEMMDAEMSSVRSTWTPSYSGPPYERLLELSTSCFCGNTWMVRRVPDRTYRFDRNLTHAEDLLFFLSIARDGLYAYTTAPVLRYRKGHGSAMNSLAGLHKGYRGLVRAVQAFPDPPTSGSITELWRRVQRIMARSYLKRGRLYQAFKAYIEPRPLPEP